MSFDKLSLKRKFADPQGQTEREREKIAAGQEGTRQSKYTKRKHTHIAAADRPGEILLWEKYVGRLWARLTKCL